jgi:hypothetical protein
MRLLQVRFFREEPSFFQLVLINEFCILLVRVHVYSFCIHVCQAAKKKVRNMHDRSFGIGLPIRSRSNLVWPIHRACRACGVRRGHAQSGTSTLEC